MKQTIETKREYARPEMTVVELKNQCCILAGSGDTQTQMNVTYDEEEI